MITLAVPQQFAILGARELLIFAGQGIHAECSQSMSEYNHCSGEFGDGDTNHACLGLHERTRNVTLNGMIDISSACDQQAFPLFLGQMQTGGASFSKSGVGNLVPRNVWSISLQ